MYTFSRTLVPACDAQTDRQTDGRTGGFTIASTALSIASYADGGIASYADAL